MDNERDSIDFAISPPFVRQIIALVGVILPLSLSVWFPLKLGWVRFLDLFTESSLGWVIYAILLSPAALFLRIAFPPRSARARLQVRRDGISFIPGRWVKRCFAQLAIDAAITANSTEVLICQRGLPNGYAVIVCSAGGSEREVYPEASLTLHTVAEGQRIAKGIAAVTKLPVRLVQRKRQIDGMVKETAWVPNLRSANSWIVGMLGTAVLPFVGGIVTGYLVANLWLIAIIGLTLWLVWRFAVKTLMQAKSSWGFAAGLYSLTSLFVFGVSYGLAVFIVGVILRSH